MRNILSIAFCFLAFFAFAQNDLAAKSKAAIRKLSWAFGEWKGSGSMRMGPGEPRKSDVHEMLTPKLDGTVLLVEGKGTAQIEGRPVTVHNALAVISYNPQKEQYEMKSWLADGRSTDAWIEVKEKGFDWGFDLPSGGKTRYIMRINDKGQWTEKGEFSMDGSRWNPFFEMTLDRVK